MNTNKGQIHIMTYTDPNYMFADTGLNKNCLHIVPSQEMIQGHRSVGTYAADPEQGGWQLVTTKALENAFYGDWLGTARRFDDRKLRQIVEVGEMLAELKPGMTIRMQQAHNSDFLMTVDENLIRSIEHHTSSLTETLRFFCELELQPDAFTLSGLCTSQLVAVYLYQQICRNSGTVFRFKRLDNRTDVQAALDRAVTETVKKRYASSSSRQKMALSGYEHLCSANMLIFDGVFQLTPTLLSVILDLKNAGYTVYLLFNYRTEPELRPFYQSWLDMYRLFECTEFKMDVHQHPPVNLNNYKLAMALGSIAAGRYPEEYADILQHTKLYEFARVTEYANYVDHSFRTALETEFKKTKKCYQNTLHYMPEMHYAASRKATDILRAYHPQQFGDRTFLDYPLGKCLSALVRLWNPEKNILEIKDFGLLGDCLRGYPDPDTDCLTNVNTYQILRSYFERLTTMNEVITVAGRILEQKKTYAQEETFENLSLHQLSEKEISGLYHTLRRINDAAKQLFGASKESVRFYERIRFVMEMLLSEHELNEHSRNVYAESLKTLLTRAKEMLGTIDEETGTVSAENKQLRMMLDEILNIAETDSSSAKWIVHDLVQIDGDILVKPAPDIARTNHFGFLSDQDMNSNPDTLLPWPLDMHFFDSINLENNANTIFHIFRQSRISAQQFPKYALIYGLLFSRDPVVLSYVHQVGDEKRDPFSLLRMLGLKPERISLEMNVQPSDMSPYLYSSESNSTKFRENEMTDSYPAQICTFRYAAERLIDRKTWYSDRFSSIAYIKSRLTALVLRETNVYQNNQFVPKSRAELNEIVQNAATKILYGETFGRLISLCFLTDSELHEIRHDVMHQSKIRVYRIVKCICKKLFSCISDEYLRIDFESEPEVQILEHFDVQEIQKKNSQTDSEQSKYDFVLHRGKYFRKAVENYSASTAMYPNDHAFFQKKYSAGNPSQLWAQNVFYDKYGDFDYHKSLDNRNGKERYSCNLCTCKSFCPHGIAADA